MGGGRLNTEDNEIKKKSHPKIEKRDKMRRESGSGRGIGKKNSPNGT